MGTKEIFTEEMAFQLGLRNWVSFEHARWTEAVQAEKALAKPAVHRLSKGQVWLKHMITLLKQNLKGKHHALICCHH